MQVRDGAEEVNVTSILWNKFIAGDNNAFAEIYKQNVLPLIRYGLIYSSDKELIKDCIHDIFVKIENNRSKLKHVDNITLYLTIALKNAIFNAKKKSIRQVEFNNMFEDILEDGHSPESSFIEREEALQTNLSIDRIMSVLTVRQKEIIYYRFMQNMSVDEIGQITNMNNQSVSNVIQRSLISIRKIFQKKVSI